MTLTLCLPITHICVIYFCEHKFMFIFKPGLEGSSTIAHRVPQCLASSSLTDFTILKLLEGYFRLETSKYFSHGLLNMVDRDINDTDNVIQQIFVNSDEESDKNLTFHEEQLEDNLPLTCLLSRTEESEDEEIFEMSSEKEEEEESYSKEWTIITRDDFNLDKSSVGLKVQMMPNKSALDFFELIFTVDLSDIKNQSLCYSTMRRPTQPKPALESSHC